MKTKKLLIKLTLLFFILNLTSNIKAQNCSGFQAIISKKDVSCNGMANGMAYVTVSGGIQPYTYMWSNNLGTENFTPSILSPSSYYCIIKDASGCQLTKVIDIKEPDKMQLSFITQPSKCKGTTGQATVIVTGGQGVVKSYWDNGSLESNSITDVAPGDYGVTVIDEKGCSIFGVAQIESNNGPDIISKTITDVQCNGGGESSLNINGTNNGIGGKIEVQVGNGTPPYSYKWSYSETNVSNSASDLKAGMYSIKITDAADCVTIDSMLVKEPNQFSARVNVTNTNCKAAQGIAEVVLTGGVAPFIYSWSRTNSTKFRSTGLNAHQGTVTITDRNGCSTIASYEIRDLNGPRVVNTITQQEKCFLAAQGTIKANVSGGRAPYTYAWYADGQDIIISNTNVAKNLLGDTYKLYVTDGNGCKGYAKTTLVSADKLEVEIKKVRPSTDGGNDGMAVGFVYGGTPPYSYFWNTGSQNTFITGLTADSNWIRVTDANGCIATAGSLMSPVQIYPSNGYCGYTNTPNQASCIDTSGCPGCTVVSRDITDFGADGTDDISDECAFELAQSYFSSLDSATQKYLHINAPGGAGTGTYYIGRQDLNTAGWLYAGHNVLNFSKVYNLTIYGDVDINGNPISILRTNPCMYYGAFEPSTMKRLISYIGNDSALKAQYSLDWSNYDSIATIGDMFYLDYCNNITIRDLELDGNIDNIVLGGGYTDGMQQGAYAGITLHSTRNSVIHNVRVHHFGYDGITIRDYYCPLNLSPFIDFNAIALNLLITNSVFTYNARNNMSWVGGMNITVNKCEFSHAGQGRFLSLPGCGLDIEYEPSGNGAWGYGTSHGRFNNCSFLYNKCYALASNINSSFCFDNNFVGCSFVGPQSLWIASRGIRFQNSNIVGVVSSRHGAPIANANQNNNNQTVFDHCNFYEQWNVAGMGIRSFQDSPDESSSNCNNPVHSFLINSVGARQEFRSCQTYTNYTLKDAWIHGADGINLQLFNKTLLYTLGMTNHGLNSCGCDHELSSIVNCNFRGNANGHVVAAGGTTFGGLRNSPPHGGSGQPPANHFFGHHMYHGVNVGANQATFDSISNTTGGFSQVCCYTNIWPTVSKYEHLPDPNALQTLFTGYPPYMYSTLTDVQTYCLDPIAARKKGNNKIINNINVYPNPASNILIIENIDIGSLIKVVDMVGCIISEIKSKENLESVDIKTLPPGIYFIYVNNLPAKKFVKI